MPCFRFSMLMLLASLFSILSISGCVSSKPPNNVDFAVVEGIGEFAGTYQNRGRGEKKPEEEDRINIRVVYLSSLLFPTLEKKLNSSILKVEIKKLTEESLAVKAMGINGVVKEGIFIKGKDFELSSGQIYLKHQFGVPLPIVGVGYKKSYLGIDQHGDGKYKESTTAVGLLALIIPIALSGTEEIRFERISE
jgi:hypothetical protein